MKTAFDDILPISIENLTVFNEENIKNNSYDILFSIRDEQGVVVNNNVYTMNEYDIIVINPYTDYRFFKNNTEIVRIKINHVITNSLFDELPNIECNSCTYKNKEKFRSIYISIIHYIKTYKNISVAKAYSLAYQFIDELVSNFKSDAPTSKVKSKLLEITTYIEKNYQENLLLNDIADHFNISVPYLSKLFKQELGTNFASYYDDLRLTNSMYEILNTENSILDIALKHGFANNQAYIRAYKKKYNELPSQTRKRYKQSPEEQPEKIVTFKSILRNLEDREATINEYKDYYIETSYLKQPIAIHNKSFKNILGIGNAKILLYDNVRQLVAKVQNNIGYKYAHIRGIISDDLSFCSRNVHGNLIFRFNLVDEIMDFLVANGFTPMMSLTFMPDAIASDKSKVIYSENANASAPNNLKEWSIIIETLIQHFIDRYEFDLVSKFIFIPWVSPDSSYNQLGFRNDNEFYQFYKTTYSTIKHISSKFKVYSPEVFPDCDENFDWFKSFMNFAKENKCLPDAISLQYFSNDNWPQVQSQLLRGKFLYSLRDYGMKLDPNAMHKYLLKIKSYNEEQHFNLPIELTSFNYTVKRNDPLLDTVFLANYVLKNYLDNFELINSYTYWNFSDFENLTTASTLFFGGAGLYFANSIPKPQAQAYTFFKFLQDEIIMRGDGYIISKNSKTNTLYLLIYNYEHPSLGEQVLDVNLKNDIYNAFKEKEKKRINVKITNCGFSSASFRIFTLNKVNGSPYDKWLSMGRPNNNQFHPKEDIVYNSLLSSAYCDYKELRKDISDNILTVDFTLDPLEIKGIQIKLK